MSQLFDLPHRRLAFNAYLVAAGVVLVSSALRLVEWPAWLSSDLWRAGMPVLPNPDTYAWLAGAEGLGRLAGWPMSNLFAWADGVNGQPPEWVAFWLPAVLAGLPGMLLAFLCAARRQPLAGLTAGVVGASSLGYLARTRLGYADTDLFALALAVALGWTWAASMRRVTESGGVSTELGKWAVLATAALVLSSYQFLYPSGYALAAAILLAGIGFAVWRSGVSVLTVLAPILAALLLASHFGLVGLVAAWLLLAVAVFGKRLQQPMLGGGVLVVAVLAVIWHDMAFFEQTLRRVGAYMGLSLAVPPVQDWQLPGVEASIAETGGLGFASLAERMASHWLLVLGGAAGLVAVLRRWPELVTFVPMLLLALAGFWLGPRFAMYAGPPLGLGLGLGLALLLGRLRAPLWASRAVQAGLALAVVVFIGWRAMEPVPDAIIEPGHADALAELRAQPNDRGRVWSWWDRGYAAQFYAGLPTLADGGSASRQRIHALGLAFGSHSPRQAAQMLKLGALARADVRGPDWLATAYSSHPLQKLERMPADLAQSELDRLAESERPWPDPLPDEFLVVDWRTLRQVQWVRYFGSWRLDEGPQGQGVIETLQPPVQLDEQRGLLQTPAGTVGLLSIDIVEAESHYHNRWQQPRGGAHAVINNDNGQGVLMDSELYQTMAVQMLIGDPAAFEPYFELMVDRFPAARVYRVR